MNEVSRGIEGASVASRSGVAEFFNWDVLWTCEKWSEDACDWMRRKLGLAPDAEVRSWMFRDLNLATDLGTHYREHNSLTAEGITHILKCVAGISALPGTVGTPQALDSTHSRVLVGEGTTASASPNVDTDLAAATGQTHRYCSLMNATFPSIAGTNNNTVTYQADFTSLNGDFIWNEWGIDNGTAAGTGAAGTVLLNRKIESLGTKTTGTWTLSGAISLA